MNTQHKANESNHQDHDASVNLILITILGDGVVLETYVLCFKHNLILQLNIYNKYIMTVTRRHNGWCLKANPNKLKTCW